MSRFRLEYILEKTGGITIYFETALDEKNYEQSGCSHVNRTPFYQNGSGIIYRNSDGKFIMNVDDFYKEKSEKKSVADSSFRVRIGFWGVKLGDLKICLPAETTEFELDDEGSEAIFGDIELTNCKKLKNVHVTVTELGKLIFEEENSVSELRILSKNKPDLINFTGKSEIFIT